MTSETTIEVLQEAVDHGLKLGFEPPDMLTFEPAERCPQDFVPIPKAYKSALLPLLRTKGVTWTELHSERLGEDLLFCWDEETKATLIEAGAEPWSVYTLDELQVLVAQNRVAPLSDDELRKLHEIKLGFNGTLT